MAANLVQEGQQLARIVIVFQTILGAGLALIFTLFFDKNVGISAAYGALVVIIPQSIFAHLAFKYGGARQNKLVVRSFAKGSKIKFAFTVVLFACAYQWPGLNIAALLTSYIVVLMAQWPIIIFRSRVKR
ncbi:MAG: F0F1 ATP synthase assembly protein I [Paraglaciecola sp.]|nr:F0F1 ATP synthase assembly protein I [Paraglaciecola sp.]NCT47018.1 F0F1 ATP synthase assembly protein I [Paraglaciecola sp.]